MKISRNILIFLFIATTTFAQNEKPDFSGRYLLKPAKVGKHDPPPTPRYLRVTQTEQTLEAAYTGDKHPMTNRYQLDGTISMNQTSGGMPSKDRARLRGKSLVIESLVVSAGVELHFKQKWQLSHDSQTLTIHMHCEAPVAGAPFELESYDDEYLRQP